MVPTAVISCVSDRFHTDRWPGRETAGKLGTVTAASRAKTVLRVVGKHLRFAGVPIWTLAEGKITELHAGLKGTMNALFLKDLAAKTRRGLRGRVEKGHSGGGLCYRYDVAKITDGADEPVWGERTINDEEAAIVRRVSDAPSGSSYSPTLRSSAS